MNSTTKVPEVSIITPVFNAARYLPQCLLSIQNQSFKNFEILLVDDVSTDDSVAVARRVLNNDPRLKILKHRHNKGAGESRNTGIRHAAAPWIMFVDSDDWIDNTFIEELYQSATAYNADIVQCGAKWVYPEQTLTRPSYSFKKRVIAGQDILHTYSQWEGEASILCVPWAKIYRKSLFTHNTIFYPPIIGEDVPVTYQLCFFARKAVVLSSPYYYYRQHTDSVTAGKISSQMAGDIFIAMDIIHRFLLQQQPHDHHFSQFADMAFRHVIWHTLHKIRLSYADDIQKFRQTIRLMDENYLKYRSVLNFDHRYIHYGLRFSYEVDPSLLKECLQYYWTAFSKKPVLMGLLGLVIFRLLKTDSLSRIFEKNRSALMNMKKLTGF